MTQIYLHNTLTRKKEAFTLIELSIVLVIIGLIVGGVLVGQDLIKAAELRKVSQKITEFDTAVMTFKLKYNGLPGDLDNAFQFFGTDMGCTDAAMADIYHSSSSERCNGNGNRYINLQGEMVRAFQQLELSGLISEGINTTATLMDNRYSHPKGILPVGSINDTFYSMRCASANGFNSNICDPLLAFSGHAYRVSSGSSATNNTYSFNSLRGAAFSSIDASSYDGKFDDGNGITGRVKFNPTNPGCSHSVTGIFRTNVSTADDIACWLAVKAAF